MINSNDISKLTNPEYFGYMSSFCDVLVKYDFDREILGPFYDAMGDLLKTAESALAAEKKSAKVRDKNEADRYRDRMHSKLFNYLKFILYDEKDPRFDDAQTVMRVVKEAGNPTRLAENLQSAMMITLGNKLEPCRSQMQAIGAETIADEMLDANRRFMTIEAEYRELLAMQQLSDTPTSMKTVRKQIDPIYKAIRNFINGCCGIPANKDAYREAIAEMNVLIARYDAMLAARKREKKQPENNQEG